MYLLRIKSIFSFSPGVVFFGKQDLIIGKNKKRPI